MNGGEEIRRERKSELANRDEIEGRKDRERRNRYRGNMRSSRNERDEEW